MATKSLTALFTVGKFLTITPPFDSQVSLFQKVHTFIFVTIITTIVVATNINREYYHDYIYVKIAVDISTDVTLLLFSCYTPVTVILWKKDEWKKLMELLGVIVSTAKNISKINRVVKISFARIVAGLGILTCEYIFWSKVNGFYYYIRRFNVHYVEYYLVYTFNVFLSLILSILLDLFLLKDTTEIINDVFGWSLALSISYTTLYILNNFDFIFVATSNPDDIIAQRVIADSVLVLLIFSSTVAVIITCDLILKEAESMLLKSYMLTRKTENLSIKDEKELKRFSERILQNFPKFSAARFLNIDRSTILSILWTVVTFFIVIVQFYSCTN
ncbi:unnamed protein product [Tenebrio molitor]|nr:unnamed protein product [Tenebrio molitor]